MQEIKGSYRQVQEERLYLMAAIIIADQLSDVREELHRTLVQICNLRSFQTADTNSSFVPSRDIARIVDASSARLQALEQRLAWTGTGD